MLERHLRGGRGTKPCSPAIPLQIREGQLSKRWQALNQSTSHLGPIAYFRRPKGRGSLVGLSANFTYAQYAHPPARVNINRNGGACAQETCDFDR